MMVHSGTQKIHLEMIDYSKAHRMALLSMDAYLEPKDFEERYGDQFTFFDKGTTQCYLLISKNGYRPNSVVVPENEIIIAFRGTQPTQFADITTDLEFLKSYESGWGYVHSGFQEALDLVFKELMGKITSMRSYQKLIFCGHSLGAGLATICMARMGDSDSELYTYGSPRVGDKEFSNNFKFQRPNSFRFRNHNDIVTRVPKIGYRHVGRMFYFDDIGMLKTNPSWIYRVKEFITGMLGGFVKFEIDSFKDHSITHYVQRLSAYIR